VKFRVTYGKCSELATDVQQMAHGGILVRVTDAADVGFDMPVELELVLPDGSVPIRPPSRGSGSGSPTAGADNGTGC